MRPLLALLLLSACAAKNPALDVLGDYLEAEQQGRYAAAHALLSDEDRSARSLDAYVSDHTEAGPIWLAVARQTSFRVDGQQEVDGRVHFDIIATHPDMDAVAAKVPGLPPEAIAASPDPEQKMLEHVQMVLHSQSFPTTSETLHYAVLEEDGRWRVWLGLTLQDRALRLMDVAQAEGIKGNLPGTIQALEDLLKVPDDPTGAVAALKEIAAKNLPRAKEQLAAGAAAGD